MQIINLSERGGKLITQLASMLLETFRETAPEAWPDMNAAMEEVKQSLAPERFSRVAVEPDGTVLGWIGGIPQYGGRVWEVHPMLVRPDRRGHGIGRALLQDLEGLVREKGGLTLWVGADDETGQTSLSNTDLLPNPCEHIANIRNLKNHPYEFYQKAGFSITGVMPDANGPGKPDIFLAKSLRN
jgi:aminoglycoside 6'-N-acetyltransferase I